MAVLKRFAAAALVGVLGASTAHAGAVAPGDAAPDVTLRDWNDRPARLADRRGRIVVLDFWASWCAPCRVALPGLDTIARRHPDVTVLAANIDATQAPADRFLAERLPQTAMTLLRDPDGDVLARFGASGMPALYLIDRDGVVRLVASGYAPEKLAEIERALEALLTPSDGRQNNSLR